MEPNREGIMQAGTKSQIGGGKQKFGDHFKYQTSETQKRRKLGTIWGGKNPELPNRKPAPFLGGFKKATKKWSISTGDG